MLLLRLPIVAATSVAAYVYPLYASYKAITAPSRPGSTTTLYSWRVPRPAASAPSAAIKSPTEMAELETWLMYWSVIAVVETVETFFGWSWSWMPFYDEGKLAFTLWLILPQTQGATYLYTTYLGPFLADHEREIDAALVDARTTLKQSILTAGQSAYYKVREALWNIPPPPQAQARDAPQSSQSYLGANPSTLLNAVRAYAPSAMDKAGTMLGAAGVSSMVDQARAAMSAGATPIQPVPSPHAASHSGESTHTTSAPSYGSIFAAAAASPLSATGGSASPTPPAPLTRSAVEQRRGALQRELAELNAQLATQQDQDEAAEHDVPTESMSTPTSTPTSTSTSTSTPSPQPIPPPPARKPSFFTRWFSRSPTEVETGHNSTEEEVDGDLAVSAESAESTALDGGYALLRRTPSVSPGSESGAVPEDATPSAVAAT